MKRLALLFAIVLVTLVGMIGVSRGADSGIPAVLSQLQSIQQKLHALSTDVQPKKFYLTADNSFKGGDATTACASGFHMASLFEILIPSQFQYLNSSIALKHGDQTYGPPSGVLGWIRTGSDRTQFSSDAAGVSNCNGWQTSDNGVYGTMVELLPLWTVDRFPGTPPTQYLQITDWWAPLLEPCGIQTSVWCVQD